MTSWLLGAYSSDVQMKPSWKNSQGIKLKDMILNEELRSVSDNGKNQRNDKESKLLAACISHTVFSGGQISFHVCACVAHTLNGITYG